MIEIFFDDNQEEFDLAQLFKFLEEIMKKQNVKLPFNIVLTGNEEIQRLNRDFRAKDRITDVLSFPWEEEDFLGEIYISIPQVAKQAPDFGATFEQELQRVSLHGVLHLLGYDHIAKDDKLKMETIEEKYLERSIY
jgi:probable rRNA maturation factor